MKQEGQFLLFTREEFKDWVIKSQFRRAIKSIQQHHTVEPSYDDFSGSNHFRLLRGMKNYHTTQWKPPASDIAQNITIFPDGTVAVCRSLDKDPAGIYGANTGSICIENVGNFDSGYDTMTMEQKKTIIFVNAVLCMKFKLTPGTDTIIYHRWFDLKTGTRIDDNSNAFFKTCPGTNFFGGNTVDGARKILIPLIVEKINELKAVAPVPDVILRLGSEGDYVTQLQQKLNRFGYNLAIDGDFGKRTEAAVKSFQLHRGLATDGIVGNLTWRALEIER